MNLLTIAIIAVAGIAVGFMAAWMLFIRLEDNSLEDLANSIMGVDISLRGLANPLIKYLCEKCPEGATIIIDANSAELLERKESHFNSKYFWKHKEKNGDDC